MTKRQTIIDFDKPEQRWFIDQIATDLVRAYEDVMDQPDPLVRWIEHCHGYLDRMIESVHSEMAREGASPVACGVGCSYCCYMCVDIFRVEAPRIADYVLREMPERLEEITKRLEQQVKARQTEPGDEEDDQDRYAHQRVPCAFLADDGSCGIYPVRPIPCRSHHSLDVARCKRGLVETGVKSHFNLSRQVATECFSAAFACVYMTAIPEGRAIRKKCRGRPNLPWQQRFMPALVLADLSRRSRKR